MMRRRLALVLACLATPAALRAQEEPQVLLGAGIAPHGATGATAGTALVLGLRQPLVRSPLDVMLDGGTTSLPAAAGDTARRVVWGGLSLVIGGSETRRAALRPVLLLGAGLYRLGPLSGAPAPVDTTTSWQVGASAGVGVDALLGALGAFASARLHVVRGTGHTTTFAPVVAGLRLFF
ncbi:MAG: hypothetical protein NW201_09010 [Gemmatimonadales bacterium]|nr:hypothetical protein [Gemmatimonadales bacterium]